MNSVAPKPLCRELLIRNDNFLVRDHQVFGIRVLPGVAILEIISRIGLELVGSLEFSLCDVAFVRPIATGSGCDRRLRVSITPTCDEEWNVVVRSDPLRNSPRTDEAWVVHASCTLRKAPPAAPQSPMEFDMGSFLERNRPVFRMDEVYEAIMRPIGLVHKGIMKAGGMIYHRDGEEVMALSINELAETHRSKFLAHPALLDAATMAGMSISQLVGGRLVAMEKTYLPAGFKEFRVLAPFGREVYAVSRPVLASEDSSESAGHISRSVKIYDRQGRLVAYYDQMRARRVDPPALLARLTADVAAGLADAASGSALVHGIDAPDNNPPPGERSDSGITSAARPAEQEAVENYLVDRITSLLGGSVDVRAQRHIPFYNLGLASTDLVDLTSDLEQAYGCNLNAGLMYEHQTVEKLASYLHESFPGKLCAT